MVGFTQEFPNKGVGFKWIPLEEFWWRPAVTLYSRQTGSPSPQSQEYSWQPAWSTRNSCGKTGTCKHHQPDRRGKVARSVVDIPIKVLPSCLILTLYREFKKKWAVSLSSEIWSTGATGSSLMTDQFLKTVFFFFFFKQEQRTNNVSRNASIPPTCH